MKKRKVLAVLVALLLVVGAGVYTYARYITSKAGSGDVEVAKWTATVKQGGTAVTDNFTLNEVVKIFKHIFENKNILKIGFDIKRQIKILFNYETVIENFEDIDVLNYIANNGLFENTLHSIIENELKNDISWYSNQEYKKLTIENKTDASIHLEKAMTMALNLPCGSYDMLYFHGRHTRERILERTRIAHARTSVESMRGASSHMHNPFVIVCDKDANEQSGSAWGLALVYSGNFEIGADAGQFGGTRFYAGLSEDFSWELESGESFVSPQAILTYSSEGFTKMSHNFHTVCRRHLGACAIQKKHPILLNLWEAFYFEVDEQKAITAINAAKNFGIDTVVLDDGWFGKRNGEETSMGDWFVNKEKFPNGLEGIIDCCKKNDLKFGLWFEPEMVGPDSDLYRAHPDWCIHIDGVVPISSRSEYILDLSREEVVNYVYETISAILSKYDISYIKWDMNRNMTDNGSAWLGKYRQGEHTHRYILGVYKLMEKFRKNFPNIFFEGCAGGGGRYDFGILYYMPQIWASDNSDAIERLKIQHGTSFVYPPETMSAHVSECPNHQTGRISPFETRGNVAQLFSL